MPMAPSVAILVARSGVADLRIAREAPRVRVVVIGAPAGGADGSIAVGVVVDAYPREVAFRDSLAR